MNKIKGQADAIRPDHAKTAEPESGREDFRPKITPSRTASDFEVIQEVVRRLAAWEASGRSHADFANDLFRLLRGRSPKV